MNNRLMLAVVLSAALGGVVWARDSGDPRDDRDRQEEQRREAAARARHERRRCGNEDEREREALAARRRHGCDGPPVIIYRTEPVCGLYFPPLPCWGEPVPARFCPTPIPRRPVYVLPGMP
jgi:hypothetical protein